MDKDKYIGEVNNAFKELTRTLLNAKENGLDDFVNDVIKDLNNFIVDEL